MLKYKLFLNTHECIAQNYGSGILWQFIANPLVLSFLTCCASYFEMAFFKQGFFNLGHFLHMMCLFMCTYINPIAIAMGFPKIMKKTEIITKLTHLLNFTQFLYSHT